jgi:superoxide dismutase, Cu-Zn family
LRMRLTITFTCLVVLCACSVDKERAGGLAERGERARTSAPPEGSAVVHLRDARGAEVGKATLTETTEGVRIAGEVNHLSPGEHGFHIHEKGMCDAPGFQSAGGHYNPAGTDHGGPTTENRHAGDLGNLRVGDDGRAAFDITARGVTLRKGPQSLLDGAGTSLMVHAKADDLASNPAGNSGERIACGIVEVERVQ